METLQYKKTYEGDYRKSYKNVATLKKEREVIIQEYQKISKKLDQNSYSKDEKITNYNIPQRAKKLDKLNADGSTGKEGDTFRKQRSGKGVTIEQKTDQDKNVAEVLLKNDSRESQKQINYAHVAYPLEEVGIDRFIDLETKQEIGIDEARRILVSAGYQPKIAGDLGKVFLLFIIANFFFKLLAPIVVIGYGLIKINTRKTIWSKKVDQVVYKYNLSASKEEIQMSKRVGQISLIIGAITAVIHYSSLIQ